MKMIIEIKSCGNCPFANLDNETGRDACNLSFLLEKEIELKNWEQLPEGKRHDECPLTNEMIFKPI